MSTPHNAAKMGDIAPVVLMPGDPLRAKFIAETFLENVTQFNTVRNMFGFTGTWNGKRVSVMGSGMGNPSIGIYCHELFSQYGVERIIRIGTCGSYRAEVKVKELVIAQGACTDSNFAYQFNLPGTYSAISSFPLLNAAVKEAEARGMKYHVGNILASDVFYNDLPGVMDAWAKMGVLAVEMESFALFSNAARLNKQALTILTVSDSLVTGEKTTAEERQTTFRDMMELALAIC